MEDLREYYINHGWIGEWDGRAALPMGELYLLDREYSVLSQYATGEVLTGTCFFDTYPLNAADRKELCLHLQGFERSSMLVHGEKGPLIVIGGLYHRTGLLPVLVPTGKERELLTVPGQLAGLLPHLTFSTLCRTRCGRYTPAQLSHICCWYSTLPMLFYHEEENVPARALVSRMTQISSLCGVALSYDVSIFAASFDMNLDAELLTGVLLGACMAVQRTSPDRMLSLYIEWDHIEGPILHLVWRRKDGAEYFPELSLLRARARERGEIFDLLSLPDDRECISVRVALTSTELSVQGLKQTEQIADEPARLEYGKEPGMVRMPEGELKLTHWI